MLYSGVLNKKAESENEKKIAGEIENGLASMSELLDALLDISKFETGSVQPEIEMFPVSQICKKVSANFKPVAKSKGLDLRVAPTSCHTMSDPVLLENIINNLVSNAIRYTDKGKVLIGCRRTKTNLEINIWDTGMGIPAQALERIFERNYQVVAEQGGPAEGSGIGLAIVRDILRLHGCTVDVESEEGRGTRFTFTLPLAPGRAEASPSPVLEVEESGPEPPETPPSDPPDEPRPRLRIIRRYKP